MADDSSESRAYTEGDRERWDLPNYGLPKSLPTKLGDVIVVLLHALRFALFLGMGGLHDLTEFIGLARDDDNTDFLQGLINYPGDFGEEDPIVDILMPGTWEALRERLLAEAGPRNVTAVLMNDQRPTEDPHHPQPRGRPPAGRIWNHLLGFDLQAKVPSGSLLIGESDEEGEDEDDGIMADDAEEGEEEEEEFAAVGDFEPPDGWVVLPEPAEDEATWTKAKAKFSWDRRRLAHIWNAPLGWQMATFSQVIKKSLSFYYPSDKLKCMHDLPLDSYGTDGHWVIIEKAE